MITARSGISLIETALVLALMALSLMVTVPSVATLRNGARLSAGAREMAMTFQALRWKSVTTNNVRGVLFEADDTGWYWYEVLDGNGNGLRTAEVRNGKDVTVSGPHRIEDRISGVQLGFPALDEIPRIPPRNGTLDDVADPVKFGVSNLVSFSPLGRSSSGTIYLTDGNKGLYAVVVFGPTVRVRVWRYNAATGNWIL
jgi:hypothetical protein